MKSVAIVGASSSAQQVKDTPAEQVWTMNHMAYASEHEPEKFPFPRVDLLLEIHDEHAIREVALGKHGDIYWAWLKKEHPFPIYMQEEYSFIPNSVPYPKDDVVEKLFKGKVTVGEEETKEFFGSSADYLTGLAIYKGAKDIYYYGCRFGRETEYRYQNSLAHVWMGMALANGVNLHFIEGDNFFEQLNYGYNAWVRIYPKMIRKDLREIKKLFRKAKVKSREKVRYKGMIRIAEFYLDMLDGQKSIGREALDFALEDMQNQHAGWVAIFNNDRTPENFDNVLLAEGAMHWIQYYIDTCDLKKPSLEPKEKTFFEGDE